MALIAFNRAQTDQCKIDIMHVACYYQRLASQIQMFDLVRLQPTCPLMKRSDIKLVCRLTHDDLVNQIKIHNMTHKVMTNSPKVDVYLCRDICLTYFGHTHVAYLEDKSTSRSHGCVCLKNLTNTSILDRNALTNKRHICSAKKKPGTFEIYPTLVQG